MTKTLTVGTLLLGCCLAAVAQMGSTQSQTPSASTPPITSQPSSQTPTIPPNPSALPPDTSATAGDQSSDSTQASSSRPMAVQGCLSQSTDGDFMLADNSGNKFHLRGESSQLASYIGNEIRVDGVAGSKTASSAGAMSSSTADAAAARQVNVINVHKISDTCVTK